MARTGTGMPQENVVRDTERSLSPPSCPTKLITSLRRPAGVGVGEEEAQREVCGRGRGPGRGVVFECATRKRTVNANQ